MDLFKLQSLISKEDRQFFYFGPISQSIIEGIGKAIKDKIILETRSFSLAIKVFSIFVEQAQNIVKYAVTGASSTEGLISLGKKDSKYFIEFGNFITISEEMNLKERLDTIRTMNKTTLIESYKAQIIKAIDWETNGVGAGFLEIAKNASGPLEYNIQRVDEKLSFFSLRALV